MTKHYYDENGRETKRGKVADTPLFDVAPLPDVPAPCRSDGPSTSADAAERVRGQHTTYLAILAVLEGSPEPLTDETIIGKLWAQGVLGTISGIKTRRNELVKAGFVAEVDQCGMTKYNRRAIRWGRTPLRFDGNAIREAKERTL